MKSLHCHILKGVTGSQQKGSKLGKQTSQSNESIEGSSDTVHGLYSTMGGQGSGGFEAQTNLTLTVLQLIKIGRDRPSILRNWAPFPNLSLLFKS